MSQEDTTTITVHPDVLDLAPRLQGAWAEQLAALRASGVPLNADDGGDDGDGDDGGNDGEGDGGSGGDDERRDQFDREYVEKLRRENAAARKARQEAEARVKEFEDRDKSDQEKAAERLQAAEQRAIEAEAKVLRTDVAAAKDVPVKLAKFLTGSTKEELEKSADELLAELNGTRRTSFDGGARGRGQAPAAGDMDAAIRAAAGR